MTNHEHILYMRDTFVAPTDSVVVALVELKKLLLYIMFGSHQIGKCLDPQKNA